MTTATLQSLTRRVADGDRSAVTTLRAELQPQLERILRRSLQSSTPRSSFTDRLRREAHGVLCADSPTDSQPCEPVVAAHLAGRVIDRLRSTAATLGPRDTLINPL